MLEEKFITLIYLVLSQSNVAWIPGDGNGFLLEINLKNMFPY